MSIITNDDREVNGKVIVRFNRMFLRWGAGEVAGFTPGYAKELIRRGYAEYYKANNDQVSEALPVDKRRQGRKSKGAVKATAPEVAPDDDDGN